MKTQVYYQTLRRMEADPDSPGDYLVTGCRGLLENGWYDLDNKPIDNVIQHLKDACFDRYWEDNPEDERLYPILNPIFRMEIDRYRSDYDINIWIEGSRRATPEEVEAFIPWKAEQDRKKQEAAAKRQQKEREQATAKKAKEDAKALARAKKAFPHLFNEKGDLK